MHNYYLAIYLEIIISLEETCSYKKTLIVPPCIFKTIGGRLQPLCANKNDAFLKFLNFNMWSIQYINQSWSENKIIHKNSGQHPVSQIFNSFFFFKNLFLVNVMLCFYTFKRIIFWLTFSTCDQTITILILE